MRVRIIQSYEPDNSGNLNEIILNVNDYFSDLNSINIDEDLNFEIRYEAIPFKPKPCNFKLKKKKKLKQALSDDVIHILYPEVDPSLWRTYIIKDCIFSIPHKKIICFLIDGRYYMTDINKSCYIQLMTVLKSLKRSKKIAYEYFKQNLDDFNSLDEDNMISPGTVNSSTTLTPVSSSSSLNSYSLNQNGNGLMNDGISNSLISPLNLQNLMALRSDLSLYTTPPSTPPRYLSTYNDGEKILEEIAKQTDFIYKEKNVFLSIFIQSLNHLSPNAKNRLIEAVSTIFNNLDIDFEFNFNPVQLSNILRNNKIKRGIEKESSSESTILTLNESRNNLDIIEGNKYIENNIENITIFVNTLHNNKNNVDQDLILENENENENENDDDYKKSKHKKKKSKSSSNLNDYKRKNRRSKKEDEDEDNEFDNMKSRNKNRSKINSVISNQQFNINFYKSLITTSQIFEQFKSKNQSKVFELFTRFVLHEGVIPLPDNYHIWLCEAYSFSYQKQAKIVDAYLTECNNIIQLLKKSFIAMRSLFTFRYREIRNSATEEAVNVDEGKFDTKSPELSDNASQVSDNQQIPQLDYTYSEITKITSNSFLNLFSLYSRGKDSKKRIKSREHHAQDFALKEKKRMEANLKKEQKKKKKREKKEKERQERHKKQASTSSSKKTVPKKKSMIFKLFKRYKLNDGAEEEHKKEETTKEPEKNNHNELKDEVVDATIKNMAEESFVSYTEENNGPFEMKNDEEEKTKYYTSLVSQIQSLLCSFDQNLRFSSDDFSNNNSNNNNNNIFNNENVDGNENDNNNDNNDNNNNNNFVLDVTNLDTTSSESDIFVEKILNNESESIDDKYKIYKPVFDLIKQLVNSLPEPQFKSLYVFDIEMLKHIHEGLLNDIDFFNGELMKVLDNIKNVNISERKLALENKEFGFYGNSNKQLFSKYGIIEGDMDQSFTSHYSLANESFNSSFLNNKKSLDEMQMPSIRSKTEQRKNLLKKYSQCNLKLHGKSSYTNLGIEDSHLIENFNNVGFMDPVEEEDSHFNSSSDDFDEDVSEFDEREIGGDRDEPLSLSDNSSEYSSEFIHPLLLRRRLSLPQLRPQPRPPRPPRLHGNYNKSKSRKP